MMKLIVLFADSICLNFYDFTMIIFGIIYPLF